MSIKYRNNLSFNPRASRRASCSLLVTSIKISVWDRACLPRSSTYTWYSPIRRCSLLSAKFSDTTTSVIPTRISGAPSSWRDELLSRIVNAMRTACPAENRQFSAYPRLVVWRHDPLWRAPPDLRNCCAIRRAYTHDGYGVPTLALAAEMHSDTLYFLFSRLIGLLEVGFAVSGVPGTAVVPPSDRIN